jgi:hypothetical protein
MHSIDQGHPILVNRVRGIDADEIELEATHWPFAP